MIAASTLSRRCVARKIVLGLQGGVDIVIRHPPRAIRLLYLTVATVVLVIAPAFAFVVL